MFRGPLVAQQLVMTIAPPWEARKSENFWGRQCGAQESQGLTSLPFPVAGGSLPDPCTHVATKQSTYHVSGPRWELGTHRGEDPNPARRTHRLVKETGTQRENCGLASTTEGLRREKGQLASLGGEGQGRLPENVAPWRTES